MMALANDGLKYDPIVNNTIKSKVFLEYNYVLFKYSLQRMDMVIMID